MNKDIAFSGATIRRWMRIYRISIRELAQRFDLSMTRVREVRTYGGPWDWPLMINAIVRERR